MAPIGINDILDRNDRGHGSVGITKSLEASDDSRSFEIDGLESDEATPTRMKEDILLLSWLVLLLRTREGRQISFEWAYNLSGESIQLSMSEVVKNMEDDIEKISAAIRQQTSAALPDDKVSASSPIPLILSTSTFSQTSEEVKEEVSLN